MKVDRFQRQVTFHSDSSDPGFTDAELQVRFTNRGEPYREGVEIILTGDGLRSPSVFLETREVRELSQLLKGILGEEA